MKRQAIQNFLSLPGITGLALMDSRARPFFCGLDTTLNSQQKDVLVKGIQQVVETTPAEFEAFSFRFTERQAHVYRLTEGVILLVITSDQMVVEEYSLALDQLKGLLKEDWINAVDTFRLLAGSITLSNHPYGVAGKDQSNHPGEQSDKAGPFAQNQTVRCDEILSALNHLSDFTTQYLGKVIVANTWKSARPDHPWLTAFEIDRSSHFKLSPQASFSTQEHLTPEQHQYLKDWVKAYVERCSKTIRDFSKILTDKGLDSHQQRLLLAHI